MNSGNKTAADELLNMHPELEDSMLNAAKLLKLLHGLSAVERYFFDNILENIYKIGENKGEWNAQMSSSASGENILNKFDVVEYPVNGVNQLFLVYGDNLQAGVTPLEAPDKYLQLSIKGDKGDAGYTPIKGIDYSDGIDGVSGLGLSPRGAWVNNKEYYQYDMVSHNGYFWYALENTIATEPIKGSDIWVKIPISLQVATGTETPNNLEDGGLWIHTQDDESAILKTKNENGEYIPIHPQTKSDYVKDANGESLQRKIYRNYFDRDDIKILLNDSAPVYTRTAVLSNNNSIVVAKEIMTDTLDENGKVTKEYTAYDETGVYVMYKSIEVFTDYGDGNYDTTTEVIIG